LARRISLHVVTFDEMETALRERLEALPPAARGELRHALRLPDFDRADVYLKGDGEMCEASILCGSPYVMRRFCV
jgi:hypothetical protein